MCIRTLYSDSTGVCYVMGGYEDGSVVLWDERNSTTELGTLQIFSEPGIIYDAVVEIMHVEVPCESDGRISISVQLFMHCTYVPRLHPHINFRLELIVGFELTVIVVTEVKYNVGVVSK